MALLLTGACVPSHEVAGSHPTHPIAKNVNLCYLILNQGVVQLEQDLVHMYISQPFCVLDDSCYWSETCCSTFLHETSHAVLCMTHNILVLRTTHHILPVAFYTMHFAKLRNFVQRDLSMLHCPISSFEKPSTWQQCQAGCKQAGATCQARLRMASTYCMAERPVKHACKCQTLMSTEGQVCLIANASEGKELLCICLSPRRHRCN